MARAKAEAPSGASYRIKELSDRSGFSRQTIRFYIAQGLLPEPIKTSHNMGWYSERHLELLLLIQKLQHERFLPLKAIKSLLQDAKISATWGKPPSADEIARLDDERLLADPRLSRPVHESEEAIISAMLDQHGPQQVAEALAAGCDAIEQGYGMGEDNLYKMAKQGVLWIPSVLRAKNGLDSASSGGEVACRFSTRYVAPGKPVPGAEAFWQKTLAEQLAQLRLAGKFGVKTAVGTGAGSAGILHGESMAEEMKLFLKGGYKLEETIRCATENGAGFFGMEQLGRLTVGRKATFLIARGTVQQLARKLSYLEGIYVDGAPSSTYRKNPVRTA